MRSRAPLSVNARNRFSYALRTRTVDNSMAARRDALGGGGQPTNTVAAMAEAHARKSKTRSTSAPGNFHPSKSKVSFQQAPPLGQGSFSSVQVVRARTITF